MKAQFLIHNEAIANNVGVAIRNNWQSMKQQGEVLEVVIRPHKLFTRRQKMESVLI